MEELKPCPFCGHNSPFLAQRQKQIDHLEEGHNHIENEWFVLCPSCSAQGATHYDSILLTPFGKIVEYHNGKENATKAWNRRAAE